MTQRRGDFQVIPAVGEPPAPVSQGGSEMGKQSKLAQEEVTNGSGAPLLQPSKYKVFLYFYCWCYRSIVRFSPYGQFLYQILPTECSGTF